MRRNHFWLSITAGLALLIAAGSYPVWANDDADTFTIDVACDARTYRQNNVDPSASGSNRGDTFIVQGKIFPGGNIPQGNNVFSPDNAGSIGSWICRGTWLVNFSDLTAGASPAFDTTQIYLLPDGSKQIFSEGLEGPQPIFRAITGGTGAVADIRGEVRQGAPWHQLYRFVQPALYLSRKALRFKHAVIKGCAKAKAWPFQCALVDNVCP